MSITLYHNPRCSKSRQTLQLLEDRGVDVDIVKYLDTPPDAAGLERILTLLDMEPRQLMRKQQKEYKALGLDDDSLSREALIQAMVENPILIERPIAINNDRAALGRPPEHVLDIL